MSDHETRYSVKNMKCHGCEAAAKDVVSKLPGYVDASFDHKAGAGVVKGDVDPKAVEQALTKIGYPAEAVAQAS